VRLAVAVRLLLGSSNRLFSKNFREKHNFQIGLQTANLVKISLSEINNERQ